MSTLADLYEKEGPSVFVRLHEATGANQKYLYQIASGLRRPSSSLARRLVEAEPSLTLEELLFVDLRAKSARQSAGAEHA